MAQVDRGLEFQPTASPVERVWAENLEREAEQGNSEAQFEISQSYMAGHVFKQSFEQTVKWLRAASDQGLPVAEANLGGLYYLGKGVPQDYSKAVYWSQKAADQGNVKGEYNLGGWPTFTFVEAVKKALIELTKRGGKRGKLGA